jgi:hypothetical protein
MGQIFISLENSRLKCIFAENRAGWGILAVNASIPGYFGHPLQIAARQK